VLTPSRGGRQSPLRAQSGQGMVEYALILALVVLVVILALILTGGQVINLYSDITATMCRARLGC
jgi:Flp pilus assembly pilin Flp